MQRKRTAVVLALLVCGVTTTVAIGADPASDVKARYAVLSAAVTAKDMTKLASLYSDDASLEVITPNGRDRVRGLESIVEMWLGAMRGGATTLEVAISDAAAKADVLTDKGTFAMKKKDGTVFLTGTYSASWRREKTIWKLTSHVLTGQ